MSTALAWPLNVRQVSAYSPPGFSLADRKRLYQLFETGILPPLNIYCQTHDPIPYFDYLAYKGVNYYHISGSATGFLAHVKMFSTQDGAAISKLNVKIESRRVKRFGLTVLKGLSGVLLISTLIEFSLNLDSWSEYSTSR